MHQRSRLTRDELKPARAEIERDVAELIGAQRRNPQRDVPAQGLNSKAAMASDDAPG
jgi:hypothetical protein